MLWMLEKRAKIKDFAVCMFHVIVLTVVQSVNTQDVWYGIRIYIYIYISSYLQEHCSSNFV